MNNDMLCKYYKNLYYAMSSNSENKNYIKYKAEKYCKHLFFPKPNTNYLKHSTKN